MAKMGRPKVESPKSRKVCIRLSEEEYKKVEKYALEHNQTITQVLKKGLESVCLSS